MMQQNILEKLGVKVVSILLLIFTFIAFIGAFFFVPQLFVLEGKTFYYVMIEIIGLFFFLCIIKMLYNFILNLPEKYDLVFATGCMLLITIIQILVVKYLEIRALDDLNKVTNMAVDLVNHKKFTNDNTYFSMYTNNIPPAIYLSQYFKLLFHFGFRNYTMVGSLLGFLSIDVSLIVASLILKEVKGRKLALFFISFNIFNPLVYLWGTFYYTTIIAIPFMMISIYLIMRLYKETKLIPFCIKTCLLTIVLYIGIQIRPTTSFVLIGTLGLIIMKLPSFNFEGIQVKSTLKKFLLGIAVICISYHLLNNYYCKLLDSSMNAYYGDTSFPATHWIMMGLKDNGSYNWEDELATFSYPTRSEKIDFHKKEIHNRIKDMGMSGLGKLVVNKLIYTWSDGSHDYPVILRASHNYTNIHKYITGQKREPLIIYCQIFNIALLLILMLQTYTVFKNNSTPKSMLMYIVLLGGFLFHLLWEANPKYSLNFMFLILFIDMEGIQSFFKKETLAITIKKKIVLLGGVLTIVTIALAFLLYPYITKEPMDFVDLVQSQNVSNKERIGDLSEGEYLSQTFQTSRAFNSATIQINNHSDTFDANYTVQIVDERDNLLYTTTFSPSTKNKVEIIEFNFDTIKPSKLTTYYIKVLSDGVKPEQAVHFCMSNTQGYDVFPHGNLTVNDQYIDGDLAFSVSYKTRTAYTNTLCYVLFIAGILLIEFIVLFYYKTHQVLQYSGDATF